MVQEDGDGFMKELRKQLENRTWRNKEKRGKVPVAHCFSFVIVFLFLPRLKRQIRVYPQVGTWHACTFVWIIYYILSTSTALLNFKNRPCQILTIYLIIFIKVQGLLPRAHLKQNSPTDISSASLKYLCVKKTFSW